MIGNFPRRTPTRELHLADTVTLSRNCVRIWHKSHKSMRNIGDVEYGEAHRGKYEAWTWRWSIWSFKWLSLPF